VRRSHLIPSKVNRNEADVKWFFYFSTGLRNTVATKQSVLIFDIHLIAVL
jgi:hypothetical protein